jgi:hypothetical protein
MTAVLYQPIWNFVYKKDQEFHGIMGNFKELAVENSVEYR